MQNTVKRFVMQNSLERNEKNWYIDLVSEIGELGKEILKETDYGKKDYALNETSVEEMGDCLFSLLGLCCEMNIEAEKALTYAINIERERNVKEISDKIIKWKCEEVCVSKTRFR